MCLILHTGTWALMLPSKPWMQVMSRMLRLGHHEQATGSQRSTRQSGGKVGTNSSQQACWVPVLQYISRNAPVCLIVSEHMLSPGDKQ